MTEPIPGAVGSGGTAAAIRGVGEEPVGRFPRGSVEAVLTHDLDMPLREPAGRLVRHIVDCFGPATAAVIHYGSHAQGSGGRPESAYDFFVVVDRYGPAYRTFAERVRPRFGPRTAIVLAKILAPNVIAVRLPGDGADGGLLGKCSVLSKPDLAAACAQGSRDHFTRGRLFQQVQLAYVRDAESREAIVSALISARATTYEWGRPYLPAAFTAERYCRVLLAASYAGEIRPEADERVEEVFAAQRQVMVPMYEALLAELARRGRLWREGDRYVQLRRVTWLERARVSAYFGWSKVRATLRWVKHIWLYDDWLEYIRHKIARRSGVLIELTPRERRWPLVFLWPKAIRYLRSRR